MEKEKLLDSKEREAILGVHAKNKVLGKDVNLANLSLRTPGFSGADLENLLNEAALLAVRRGKNEITMEEIDEATGGEECINKVKKNSMI